MRVAVANLAIGLSTSALLVGLALLAIPAAGQVTTDFPLLHAVIDPSAAVTPREYTALRPVLEADLAKESQEAGGDASEPVADLSAQRVPLGKLGEGFLFSEIGPCGATGNCGIVLVYPKPGGGYQAVDGGGSSVNTSPGANGVPDIYFSWNMSVGTGTVTRLRFDGTSYIAAGSEGYDGDQPVAENGQPTFPIPEHGGLPALESLSPSEYDAARGAIGAVADFEDAHGVFIGSGGYPDRLVALKTTDCDHEGNCAFFLLRSTATRGGMGSPVVVTQFVNIAELRGWELAAGVRPPDLSDLQSRELLEATLTIRNPGGLSLEHLREVPADQFGPDRLVRDQCATTTDGVTIRRSACGVAPPQRGIPVDAIKMQTVLRDSSGTVWGISQGIWQAGRLYRWQPEGWQPVAPPPGMIGLSGGIRPAHDGGVEAYWSNFHGLQITTWMRGDAVQVVSEGASPEPAPQSDRTFTDAAGDIWRWDGPDSEGFVLVRNGQDEPRSAIAGLPDKPILAVADWDAGHVAAIVGTPGTGFDGGFYLIDIRTLQAKPVDAPRPGVFDSINEVFRVGDDRFVVTDTSTGRETAPVAELWRLRNGVWQEVVPQLGATRCCTYGRRAWAAAGDGVWIAAYPAGLWYVPPQGAAMLVDWRHGLPLSGGIQTLFALDADHLFALGGDGAASFDTTTVLSARPAATDFSMPGVNGTLATDAAGNVWGLQPDALMAWDGHHWSSHPYPAGVTRASLSGVNIDNTGKVWLLPGCRMGPMAVFSPLTGAWTVYQDYRGGLSQQPDGFHFLNRQLYLDPVMGPGHQMAFFGPCLGLNNFDGTRWHITNNNQFVQQFHAEPVTQPAFGADGSLLLNIEGSTKPQTYAWTPNGWQPRQFRDLPLVDLGFSPFDKTLPAPPPGCDTPWPESLAFDSRHRGWWTAAGNLYVGTAGNCRVALAASEIQPFVDGRGVTSVTLDRDGNAFVSTNVAGQVVFVPAAASRGIVAPIPPAR